MTDFQLPERKGSILEEEIQETIFRTKITWEFIVQEQIRTLTNLMSDCFLKNSPSRPGLMMVIQRLRTMESLIFPGSSKKDLQQFKESNAGLDEAFKAYLKNPTFETYYEAIAAANYKYSICIRALARRGKYLSYEVDMQYDEEAHKLDDTPGDEPAIDAAPMQGEVD